MQLPNAQELLVPSSPAAAQAAQQAGLQAGTKCREDPLAGIP
jgi:hypothetical protein